MAEENGDQGKAGDQGGEGAANLENNAGGDQSEISLLDRAKGGGEEGNQNGEDKGGQGDKSGQPAQRPDFIPEKFWDAKTGQPRTEALARSYAELEGKLRAGPHKAPAKADDYKIELGEDLKAKGLAGIATDDPMLKSFREAAHAEGLSNEAANRIVNQAIKAAIEANGLPVDPVKAAEAEFEKLGKGAQSIIDGLAGWGNYLKSSGILSGEEMNEFRFMAGTALGCRVLAKLRELSGEQPIPMDTAVEDGLPGKDELYAMTADAKYGHDQAYTAKVDRMFEKVFGTNPAGQSPGLLGRG